MKRIFLGGAATGTVWREATISRLISLGVSPDAIVNPHLPPGVHYTPGHKRWERSIKNDPDTIVLIYICRAAVVDQSRAELIGPISMYEIGRYAYSAPERTAVVLDYGTFSEGGRSRRNLEGIDEELRLAFNDKQPYFPTLALATEWAASELSKTDWP